MQKQQVNPAGFAPSHPSIPLHDRVRDAVRAWLAVDQAVPVIVEHAEETLLTSADWPSLDVVYEEVQDAIAAQNERLKTIDTKANFGLVAGTLLTAGVTGLGRALVEAGNIVASPRWLIGDNTLHASQVVDAVTVLSLLAYAAIAVCAYVAYKLRTFKEAPQPQRLIEKYVYEDPNITKAAITKQRAKNYENNETQIELKAKWTNLAMVFLIVEAFLLLVIAVVQVTWL